MKDDLLRNLHSRIDASIVNDLVTAYEGVVAKHRAGDAESALTRAGKFVEHTFRALEYIRTGVAPVEIKSPAATARTIENDTGLPESIRLMIPRIALAMIYDVRSKRGAVHVKEIDPREIDVDLAVTAASWVMAELLRLYHVADEASIKSEMRTLTRANIPFVEDLGGEKVVTQIVPPRIEMLLLLARTAPDGLTRTQLGRFAKCRPPQVTRALQELEADRLVHKTKDGVFHSTSPGAMVLADWLEDSGEQRLLKVSPSRRPRTKIKVGGFSHA
jgi:hypothetical protein